jgi:NADH:ubiquinone reductase (H+-translocating)
MKHVVIVGGGFAGLGCARRLVANPDVRVTLIDRNNYHQFQPLLYQVASSQLSPSNVAFNLRDVLHGHENADVKLGTVVSADLATHTVHTAEGQTYQGDILVLAAGSEVNFFGTPGADQHSYPLYSLRDAEKLRSRIIAMVESVDRDPSLVGKGALHFVIVGGGATGTELSGAFGDMVLHLPKEQLVHLNPPKVEIVLVDAGQALLNGFTPKSQAYAAKSLQDRTVELRLNTRVKEVHSGHVVLSDGSRIDTRTVIWAGGLKASALSESLGIKTGHGGRIDVERDLSVPGVDGVYALGDFANIVDKHGKALPQLASVAQQSGNWCAKNILADLEGKARKPFSYFDKGIMAMIGRNAAVAEVGEHRHELEGAVAFAAWIGVHAVLLTSMRARMAAFVEWAWDYFGAATGDAVLDVTSELNINWNDDDAAPAA